MLDNATTYYWRIDEIGVGGKTTGQVWSFTTIMDPSLSGWWKFNETSGNTAHDFSGNEYNGQLVDGLGAGLEWMPLEDSLNFDGSSSLSRVVIPTTGISTAAGTISIWANLASPQTRVGYIFGFDDGGNDKISIYMDNTDAQLDIKIGNRSENNIITFSTGAWYHLAITWEANSYSMYVNGLKLTTGTYVGLRKLPSTADIGNNGDTSIQSFNGLIGDVKIYTKSLSSTEVQQLYEGSDY
jgi:hypothetical protein